MRPYRCPDPPPGWSPADRITRCGGVKNRPRTGQATLREAEFVLENAETVGTLAVMPAAPVPHVLVVDDEPIVRDVLTRYLTRAGYQVSDAGDGEQALEAISAGHPDVVLLDLMLPRVNGLDVLRTVRRDSDVPVIVLSARSSERERIDGLRQGADDYVVKPYSPGEVVPTTRKEFELLHLLVRHPGQVFSRRQLLERVCYDSGAGTTDTVTVHIRRLRAKVELEP